MPATLTIRKISNGFVVTGPSATPGPLIEKFIPTIEELQAFIAEQLS